VLEDNDEEEEAAFDLVHRSQKCPKVNLAPSLQPPAGPTTVDAASEQARLD